MWAEVSDEAVVTTPLTITSSTQVTCSFAGGCELDIEANGIDTLVQLNATTVTVCGEICTRAQTSTDSLFKCEVPTIVTECTEDLDFYLTDQYLLRGTYDNDDGASTLGSVLFDGSLYEDYTSGALIASPRSASEMARSVL